MKIIFIKNSTQKNATLNVTQKHLLIFSVMVVSMVSISVGSAGYYLGINTDKSIAMNGHLSLSMQDQVDEQIRELSETRKFVRSHINALGQRVGSLQAQVSRVNAVSKRLAKTADVDLASFSFEQDPPVGGTSEVDESDSDAIDLENAIQAIERQLTQRENEIAQVDYILSKQQLEIKQTPNGWPVKDGWVSSKFGSRMHPTTGRKQFHRGVDIPGKIGKHVLAVANGVVIRSERKSNYGWCVEIDHGDKYSTLYAHNRRNLVKVGDTVIKGQAIAEVGSTGRSTGPHVHFEVKRNNKNINPVKYLYKKT